MRIISVGFTIFEAQNLDFDDLELLNPLVVVRCCNNEYVTKTKKKKYNVVNWEESHIWDRIVLSEIEWNVAKIEFEIQSANAFWRNEIIGVISFELKLIKNKKNHQIQGIYPILYKNGTEVKGQLRLKVIVCDEKDYAINNDIFNDLKEQDNDNLDNDELYADLSKAVIEENNAPLRDKKSRFYYLYVNIHKVEDIYVDINKKNYRDLYITCEFNGCQLKSSQGRNRTSYTYNECFKIPIATPILEDSVIIKIWDWNFLSNDELLAIGVLSFTQIKNKSINPTWFNLYGFHKNEIDLESNWNNKMYNDFNVSLEGNFYMGRICISAYVERLSNFDNLNVAITQSCLAYDEPLSIPITLLCDVYLVTGILAENIYVQLCCGPHKKKTDYVNVNETQKKKKKKNYNNKESPIKRNEFFNLFNFDDLLNLDNFFNKVTEKQKLIENNENTEFYFSSRKGKIENMKLCVVNDELQQWDVIINVYEKVKNDNNANFFNNFLFSNNEYDSIENKESKMTDYQKYKRRKERIKEYEQKENFNNDRRLAYYRIPLKNVLLHNEKISRCPIWIPLKNIPRNADGNFNSMYNILQNGSILINLEKAYDVQLGINKRKNLIPVSYELRCYIYACRNVVSHFNDSPNTFVHISCSGKMKITSLVLNNSNPVFLQCLKLNIDILTDYSIGLPTIPLIIVTLYEFYNNTFYFIGRCFCNYDTYLKDNYQKYHFINKSSNYNVVEQIKPRWIKLKGSKYVKAMYQNNLWQQYGNDKRIIQETLYEKQKEIYHNKENVFQYNNLLHGERVGDILLYFELVQSKDAIKIPIYPMITEIKKCSLTFFCMSLENLVLMKKQNYLETLLNKSTKKKITHPIVILSITSYSSHGKKKNELLIKYEKSLKANTRIQLKNWKNSFDQQSFEMFSIEKMDIDIPLDPIFDPTLNIKVYNKKIKQKYFIGETNISLVPYLPWIKNLDEAINYLQAHDDYSETINFKNIDDAFNVYKNKNATLVITAISLADCEHTIDLKEELNKFENDDMWNEIPLFNMNKEKQNGSNKININPNEQNSLTNNYLNNMYNVNNYNMYNNMIDSTVHNINMLDNSPYNDNMIIGNNMYTNNNVTGQNIYNDNMNGQYIYNNYVDGQGMYNNNNMIVNNMPNANMDNMLYNTNMPDNDVYNTNVVDQNQHVYNMNGGGDGNNMYNNNMMIDNMYNNNIYNPSKYGMINYNNNYSHNMQSFDYNNVNINNQFSTVSTNMHDNYYNKFQSYYKPYKKDAYNVKYNDYIFKLFDDGVPEIIKLTYNVKNYPYIKILTSRFILNVFIPPRFIIYVEGDKLNTQKFIKNLQRVSVDGILENYLDDILIPSIPLKKKCNTFLSDDNIVESKIQKEGISFGCFEEFPFIEFWGGYIKCFAKLKYGNLLSENIPESLKDIESQYIFRNKFRGVNKIPLYLKIRVYVLRGIGLYGINKESMANPYLIFSLGEKTSNLRNSFKKCNINPEFHCLWESEAIFPEDEILTISVYSAEDNYDKQINDLYIGSTEIHLFDRWMSKEWRHMMKKNKIPIEYRPLYNDNLKGNNDNIYNKINNWNNIFSFFDMFTSLVKYSTSKNYSKEDQILLKNSERNNFGTLEMWVEIMDYEQSKKIPIHKMISPQKTEVEIRIIIWRCTILSDEDSANKAFDLVVTTELDCPTYSGKNPTIQSTDVHYNCKSGNGLFNWRIVYPNIGYPLNTCFLQMAMYNNNNIGVSEFLGEVNLELSKYICKASKIMNKIELEAELKLRKKQIGESKRNNSGYIQVTVQFIPQEKANIKPVGLGREEPNRNPYLRTPDSGREWNDFINSIGFNDIYKPFWNWLRMIFICLLIIWVFFLSFIYPALLL